MKEVSAQIIHTPVYGADHLALYTLPMLPHCSPVTVYSVGLLDYSMFWCGGRVGCSVWSQRSATTFGAFYFTIS